MPEIGYQFNNKWEAGLEIGIKTFLSALERLSCANPLVVFTPVRPDVYKRQL